MVNISAHIGNDKYRTVLHTAKNELVADEPASDGGKEEGFAPAELLAASLGACTCITLRMYANRKFFPLDSIDVSVSLETDTSQNIALMKREITLHGKLSAEQRERLLHIANLCPVHKLLSNPIQISTSIR